MRKFVLALAIAALLALPGMSFGQNDIYVLSGYLDTPPGVINGGPDSGIPQIDVAPGPMGTPIVIDIAVESAVQWAGVSFAVTADSGGGPMSGNADWIYNNWVSGVTPQPGDWGAGGGDPITKGQMGLDLNSWGPMGPTAAFSGMGWYPAGEQLVCTFTLTSAAPLLVGQTWMIEADFDPGFGTGVTPPGSFSVGSLDLLVNVTPEPATALLLIGALPFLRRRR